MKQFQVPIQFPLGTILVTTNEKEVLKIEILPGRRQKLPEKREFKGLPQVVKDSSTQIQEYFERKRKNFDLPIKLEGTEFQKKVWKELTRIPFGKTRSYGEIATKIGSPKASRAVGGANKKNQFPLVIPCHRVIGHSGTLVGFASGVDIKSWLLDLEKESNS